MSDMFANYENLSNTYVPNNQKKEFIRQEVFDQNLPKKEYNIYGDFIGYSFNYGDTVVIHYSINKTVFVEDNAIVYTEAGECPNDSTTGIKGQKAYNTVDLKCWICTSLDSSIYEWKEICNFIFPKKGTQEITLFSKYNNKNLQDENNISIKFTIRNFRYEILYSNIYSSDGDIDIIIDKELSAILLKGIYYCSVEIFNENISYIDSTFLLIVKTDVKDIHVLGE